MEHKISEPNARIDVADVLRGLALQPYSFVEKVEMA